MKVALLPPITREEREAQARSDELNKLVWITCRVCGLKSRVGLDNPALLCNPCRVDPVQTEGHVLHLRDTYRERLWRARRKWDDLLERMPSEVRQRWVKVVGARERVALKEISEVSFNATWQRARAAGGDFAALLLARESFEAESDECNEALERINATLAEIAAYVDSSPPASPHARGSELD